MPNAAKSNPPMTETIDSANAAASTLFLGHNGDWWDFWLIISGTCVAVAATAVGVTTTGSLVAHKREAMVAGQELTKYKLDTSKDIADANSRTSQAQLELQHLKSWRMVDGHKFKAALTDIDPPKNVEILYVPECSDCFMLGSMAVAILNDMNWPVTIDELKKQQNPSQGWMIGVPATLQHRANPTGMTILTKEQLDPIKKTIVGGLMQAFGEALAGGMISNDQTIAEGVVRVVIAPKI
jgi:hypothetical protein